LRLKRADAAHESQQKSEKKDMCSTAHFHHDSPMFCRFSVCGPAVSYRIHNGPLLGI
jgi:hypothetical protein